MRKTRSKNKKKEQKILIGSVAVLGTLLVIYLSMSFYFMKRFYFGTIINGVKAGGKTVEVVNSQIAKSIDKYTLTLEERKEIKEEIKGADIGLKYSEVYKVGEVKSKQRPFKWLTGSFNKKNYTLSEIISFNEKLLKEKIDNLSCFVGKDITEPKDASFKYTDKGYEIVEEVNGNKVIKEKLLEEVKQGIINLKSSLDLDKADCYEKPKYTKNSKEIIDTNNLLNKYISSKITYTFGDNEEVLDASEFNTWIKVDENLGVTIDEEKVKNYVKTLSGKYDTYGTTRSFSTSTGKVINIKGGNYGYRINRSKESSEIIEAIKQGETVKKKPSYSQTAKGSLSNDIGNTYVEIDMSKQHLWLYKNKTLLAEGDIVTGNMSKNYSTPAGTYRLTYKQKDATLKGTDYETPVSYWMPFNGNIGLHDATWRKTFGGNIYQKDGSHGCVNAPFGLAEIVFNNIEAGTPVVCYY